jgi:hypothetical protein
MKNKKKPKQHDETFTFVLSSFLFFFIIQNLMSIGCKSYQTISNLLLIALVNTTMRAGVWSSWAVSETTPALGQRRTAGCG